MPLSAEERRFLRSWEEQRKDGKTAYLLTYTFGLTILIFLSFAAIALFSSLPFIRKWWLISAAVASVVGAISISLYSWNYRQKKFRKIIEREMSNRE